MNECLLYVNACNTSWYCANITLSIIVLINMLIVLLYYIKVMVLYYIIITLYVWHIVMHCLRLSEVNMWLHECDLK